MWGTRRSWGNTVQHLKAPHVDQDPEPILVHQVSSASTLWHSGPVLRRCPLTKSCQRRWSQPGAPQTVGFFPTVDCCCCRYVGLFTRGFLRLGLLLALVSWTTKKDRTTMAPRKAKTGMV